MEIFQLPVTPYKSFFSYWLLIKFSYKTYSGLKYTQNINLELDLGLNCFSFKLPLYQESCLLLNFLAISPDYTLD